MRIAAIALLLLSSAAQASLERREPQHAVTCDCEPAQDFLVTSDSQIEVDGLPVSVAAYRLIPNGTLVVDELEVETVGWNAYFVTRLKARLRMPLAED